MRLRPPGTARAPIAEFPTVTLAKGHELWRCHRRRNGPWFFASEGANRFDLVEPRGTCYLADLPVIACLEAISHGSSADLVVSSTFLAERVVRCLPLPVAIDAADATDGGARRFGVTRELHDIADYGLPQAWAEAWADAGFGGVHYLATNHQRRRGDRPWRGPGAQGPGCWALFGGAGERARWRRGRARPVEGPLLDELAAHGVVVADVPSLDSLTVVAPD